MTTDEGENPAPTPQRSFRAAAERWKADQVAQRERQKAQRAVIRKAVSDRKKAATKEGRKVKDRERKLAARLAEADERGAPLKRRTHESLKGLTEEQKRERRNKQAAERMRRKRERDANLNVSHELFGRF